MALQLRPFDVPLRLDGEGVVRVGGTRVTLDTVIHAFRDGASPEEVVQGYDTLRLADVYAVVAYYLAFRTEVDAYLSEREQRAEAIRQAIRSRTDMVGIRERLLARQAAKSAS